MSYITLPQSATAATQQQASYILTESADGLSLCQMSAAATGNNQFFQPMVSDGMALSEAVVTAADAQTTGASTCDFYILYSSATFSFRKYL
jgi:hypothetical protein